MVANLLFFPLSKVIILSISSVTDLIGNRNNDNSLKCSVDFSVALDLTLSNCPFDDFVRFLGYI